jgi:NAD(P)-dependent dehydrogenase (short-subunit alcohol dehydrogenase family)
MEVSLEGRVAIVTGSGRGLGLAYAQALARAGAAVVVNDVDDATTSAAVSSVVEQGGKAVGVTAVIGSADSAQALVDAAVGEFGRLDILVTNAGILRDTVLWKMTDDEFDDVIRVHLRGTFTCVRAAATYLRRQGEGGNIVCVGSPTGQVGNFGQTNYAAAKAGIVGMVRTWALELQRAGIATNAVVPVAATAMTESAPFLKPHVDALRNGEPLPAYVRRELSFGTPDEVAGLVVFLASVSASEVNGQVLALGGDRLALWSHPAEVAVAFADGGWRAEAIAEAWSTQFAPLAQPVGQHFPEQY